MFFYALQFAVAVSLTAPTQPYSLQQAAGKKPTGTNFESAASSLVQTKEQAKVDERALLSSRKSAVGGGAGARVAEVEWDKEIVKMRNQFSKIESDGIWTYDNQRHDADRYVDGEDNYEASELTREEVDMAAVKADLTTFKGFATSESTRMEKESGDNKAYFDKANEELTAQGSIYEQDIDGLATTLTGEHTSTSDTNNAELEESAAAFEGVLESSEEEAKRNAQITEEKIEERFSAFTEKLKEDGEEYNDRFEDEESLSDDLKDVNKDMNKEILADRRELIKAAERTQKQALAATPVFRAQGARNVKLGTKIISSTVKDLNKEMKSIEKDMEDEADDIEDETKDKTKELEDDVKESGKEHAAEAKEIKKEDANIVIEATSAQLDAEMGLEDANGAAGSLENDASILKSDGALAITNNVESTDLQALKVEGKLQSAKTAAVQELGGARSAMNNQVNAKISEDRSGVEERADTQRTSLAGLINDGASQAQTAIQGLQTDAGGLEAEITSDDSEIAQLKLELSDVSTALKDAGAEVPVQIGATKTAALATVGDVTASIESKLVDARGQLANEYDTTSGDTVKLAEAVGRDLKSKVTGLKEEATAQLSRTSRSIASATQRGNDFMRVMKKSIVDFAGLMDGINTQMPDARATVSGTLTSFNGAISGAKSSLANTKTAVEASMKTTEDDVRAAVQKELMGAREVLNGQLGDVSSQMEGTMEGLGGTFEDLKKNTIDDYDQGSQFSTDMASNVEASITKMAAAAAESKKVQQEITATATTLDAQVNAGIDGERRDKSVFDKTSLAQFYDARKNSTKKGDRAVADAMTAELASLKGFEAEVSQGLDLDLTRVNDYNDASSGRLSTLTGVVGQIADKYDANQRTLADMEARAHAAMASNQDALDALDSKAKGIAAEQSRLMQQQKSDLGRKQGQMLGGFSNDVQNELGQFGEMQASKFTDEQTRMGLLAAKGKAEIQEVNGLFSAQTADIANQEGALKNQIQGLEDGEKRLTDQLYGDEGGVKATLTAAQQAVRDRERRAQDNLNTETDSDLDELGHVLGALGASKDLAGAELGQMDSELRAKLASMQGEGGRSAAELEHQLAQMVNAESDPKSIFMTDTEESRTDLADAHDRVIAATDWAKDVLASFDAKLDAVKEERVADAEVIHTNGDALKRAALNETENTKETIEKIRIQTVNMKEDMLKQLAEFKGHLTGLPSAASAGLDPAQIDTMDDKLFDVMAGHSRLMEWKHHYAHHTVAWRDEVDSQLRSIGRGVAEEGADSKNARLESEIATNNGLRKLQLRVAGQVAQSQAAQSKQYSDLATSMGSHITESLSAQADNEARIFEDDKKAEEGMERKKASQNGALDDMHSNQLDLESQAGALEERSKVASGEVATMFELPKLTASAYNQETDSMYDQMHVKLTRAQQSLLETGNLRIQEEPSSFAEVASANSVDEDEYESILGLNAELAEENLHMSKENIKLNVGLDHAKKKIAEENKTK